MSHLRIMNNNWPNNNKLPNTLILLMLYKKYCKKIKNRQKKKNNNKKEGSFFANLFSSHSTRTTTFTVPVAIRWCICLLQHLIYIASILKILNIKKKTCTNPYHLSIFINIWRFSVKSRKIVGNYWNVLLKINKKKYILYKIWNIWSFRVKLATYLPLYDTYYM